MVRRDIAKTNGPWSDEILWYAKAINELWKRDLDDKTGWRYMGAIHGIDLPGWKHDGIISDNDQPPAEADRIWNQCQHGGWFFLPWHRGYLASLEKILAKTIKDLGGPDNWCLPYWNYLNADNPDSRDLPVEFKDATMPDGSPNPLSSPPRGGTDVLEPQTWFPRDINLGAMSETQYTSAQNTVGFGGGETGFMHFGGMTGGEEGNPHNYVHVLIGGVGASAGWMTDPNYAALDPIFWLHHCNIDRLWEAWLSDASNTMESGADWVGGPMPRQFEMPDENGNLTVFTPGQTLPGGPLAPTYDDLHDGTGVAPVVVASAAPTSTLGGAMPASLSSSKPKSATLMGANSSTIKVGSEAADTVVKIDQSETAAASGPVQQRLFLNLENIRGEAPSGVLDVYISSKDGGAVTAGAGEHVDTVVVFGLAKASASDDAHGGNGTNMAIDITDLAKKLAQEKGDLLDQLEIRIVQPGGIESEITVGRVSIYRQPID